MWVLNIHKRTIYQPKTKVVELLLTLATENDKIWPTANWPAIKFKEGIKIGSKGGHGPIRYTIEKYDPNEIIQFRFSKPDDFIGIHKFEIKELGEKKTEISHTIDMNVKGKGMLTWFLGIRSLHNALIEDAFDKFENNFSEKQKSTKWNFWVRILRNQIAKKKK